MATVATSDTMPPNPLAQEQKKENQPAPPPATASGAVPATADAPAPAKPAKMSAAEMKAKKQAEKAARRAKVVAAKPPPDAATPAATPSGGNAKGPAPTRPDAKRRPSVGKQQVPPMAAVPTPAPVKEAGPTIPDCFSHMPVAKRIPLSEADKDVHPAVLAVGQQMATFTLRDNVARLEASLLAFKKVIESYESPPNQTLTRHFVPHVLNPQIEYLAACRPMCFAMGNGIRMLKTQVTKLDHDLPEEDAKKELCEAIEIFIQERVIFAELVIAKNAAKYIESDEIILTYGNQRLVRKAIQQAWADGRRFQVAIVDDPYDQGGQELGEILQEDGMRVHYYPNLAGLNMMVKLSSKVMLGAEAIFSNGSIYGPAGTCDIAMIAKDHGIRVDTLCETVNCDKDRLAIDSLTYNEIDPERQTAESFRLLFDTTPDKYVSSVVTEYDGGIQSLKTNQEDAN